MKRNIIFVFMLFVQSYLCYGQQQPNCDQVHKELQELVNLKWDYEKYLMVTKSGHTKRDIEERDSVYRLYSKQTQKIKKSPDIYLRYIKCAIKNKDSVSANQIVFYKYINSSDPLPIDFQRHYIHQRDFLKVVKYSLFDKNDSFLPEDFRGLPIINEDDYNGYNELDPIQIANAFKFLKDSLSLSRKEINFFKRHDNAKHAIGIMKYVSENGLNDESVKFIRWAIDYLKKYNGFSVAYLEGVYMQMKYENYVPKDKQPDGKSEN